MSAAQHRRVHRRTAAAAAVTAAVATAMTMTTPAANAGIAESVGDAMVGLAETAATINATVSGIAQPGAEFITGLPGGFISATPSETEPGFSVSGPLDFGAGFSPIAIAEGTNSLLQTTVEATGPVGSSVKVTSFVLSHTGNGDARALLAGVQPVVTAPAGLGTVTPLVGGVITLRDDGIGIDPEATLELKRDDMTLTTDASPGSAHLFADSGAGFTGPSMGTALETDDGNRYGVRLETGGIDYDKDDGLTLTGPSLHVDTGDTHTEIGAGKFNSETGYESDVSFNEDIDTGGHYGD